MSLRRCFNTGVKEIPFVFLSVVSRDLSSVEPGTSGRSSQLPWSDVTTGGLENTIHPFKWKREPSMMTNPKDKKRRCLLSRTISFTTYGFHCFVTGGDTKTLQEIVSPVYTRTFISFDKDLSCHGDSMS